MSAVRDAAAQAWPPFVLVVGLLVIGRLLESEGAFRALAAAITRGRATPVAALAALLALDAVVTAILNLDTAVAFLTPIMLYAARGTGAAEAPSSTGVC